jgi:hypothetical protein
MSRHTAEMRKLMRQMQQRGYEVSFTGKGHYRITGGALAAPLFVSSTPSDWRTFRAVRHRLKLGDRT